MIVKGSTLRMVTMASTATVALTVMTNAITRVLPRKRASADKIPAEDWYVKAPVAGCSPDALRGDFEEKGGGGFEGEEFQLANETDEILVGVDEGRTAVNARVHQESIYPNAPPSDGCLMRKALPFQTNLGKCPVTLEIEINRDIDGDEDGEDVFNIKPSVEFIIENPSWSGPETSLEAARVEMRDLDSDPEVDVMCQLERGEELFSFSIDETDHNTTDANDINLVHFYSNDAESSNKISAYGLKRLRRHVLSTKEGVSSSFGSLDTRIYCSSVQMNPNPLSSIFDRNINSTDTAAINKALHFKPLVIPAIMFSLGMTFAIVTMIVLIWRLQRGRRPLSRSIPLEDMRMVTKVSQVPWLLENALVADHFPPVTPRLLWTLMDPPVIPSSSMAQSPTIALHPSLAQFPPLQPLPLAGSGASLDNQLRGLACTNQLYDENDSLTFLSDFRSPSENLVSPWELQPSNPLTEPVCLDSTEHLEPTLQPIAMLYPDSAEELETSLSSDSAEESETSLSSDSAEESGALLSSDSAEESGSSLSHDSAEESDSSLQSDQTEDGEPQDLGSYSSLMCCMLPPPSSGSNSSLGSPASDSSLDSPASDSSLDSPASDSSSDLSHYLPVEKRLMELPHLLKFNDSTRVSCPALMCPYADGAHETDDLPLDPSKGNVRQMVTRDNSSGPPESLALLRVLLRKYPLSCPPRIVPNQTSQKPFGKRFIKPLDLAKYILSNSETMTVRVTRLRAATESQRSDDSKKVSPVEVQVHNDEVEVETKSKRADASVRPVAAGGGASKKPVLSVREVEGRKVLVALRVFSKADWPYDEGLDAGEESVLQETEF